MEYRMDEWIGYWIKRIYRDMTNLHDQKLSRFGLTTAQMGVMAQLWENDGLTQKEIHEKLGIRPASLSNLLDGLVANGMVVRKLDPDDARVKRIFLTQQGREIEETCLQIVTEMNEILERGFSKEEIALILSWMKRVHRNVE